MRATEWKELTGRPDGVKRGDEERRFCCTIFKVFIGLYVTVGLSLMKLFFLFSLPSLFSPVSPNGSLPLSPYHSPTTSLHAVFSPLRLSALFISAHFCFIFDGSLFVAFPTLHLHPPRIQNLCAPISPRWIIAPRTAQPTQVQIMSLLREHCCLSRARPLKVLISVTVTTDEQAVSLREKRQRHAQHFTLL